MFEKRTRAVIWLGIVLSALPTLIIIPFPTEAAFTRTTLWLASTLGYVGIVLLLWQYILGAKSVFGLFFQDLAPVLRIHKKLGKYGTLFIFLHPAFVTLSYGEQWFYSVVPAIGTEFERHVTLGRLSLLFIALTWGVSWFLKKRMAFRPWKYLHYLAYIALPFAFLHVPDVGSNFMSSFAVKLYFAVLVLIAILFTLLRIRGLLNLDKIPYEVVSNIRLNDSDYLLTLKPRTNRSLAPNRGQYVYLKLGIVSEDHPFSVLQHSPATNDIVLGYRLFGSFTKVVSQLQPGAKVSVGGPFGSFMQDIEASSRPVAYLSGGIGITPFVDQIFHLAGKREQWLFAANRSRATAILVPQVAPFLDDHLVSIYSNESSVLAPREEAGFITAELLQKYLQNPSLYTFYLCGPPQMMKAMSAVLHELDVPEAHIYSEKFGW